jgi:hypothetical protein
MIMAETFFYLTTVGRKTGQPHQIEIWFVQHNGCFYLCSERRESADWIQNSFVTPQVQFYVAERGYDPPGQDGIAVVEDDPTTIAAVKSLFDAKYNWSNGLFLRICPVDD